MVYERLMESINTVKDLLKSNQEIREKMDKFASINEGLQAELYQVKHSPYTIS